MLTETSQAGQHTLRVRLSHPEVWTTIYALSRKPASAGTSAADPKVKHISTDLLAGVNSIRSAMASDGVKDVDHNFFTAHKENSDEGLWSGQKEMWDENGKMFEDFLIVFERLQKGRRKRVVLQTGSKHYGHFGEVLAPCREEDPRLDDGPYAETLSF